MPISINPLETPIKTHELNITAQLIVPQPPKLDNKPKKIPVLKIEPNSNNNPRQSIQDIKFKCTNS